MVIARCWSISLRAVVGLFLVALLCQLAIAQDIYRSKSQYLPVDSDHDGVLNENDECYKTPVGSKVDNRGCTVTSYIYETIRLKINFDYNSAEVKAKYPSEVEKVADFMSRHPETEGVLEAHTDDIGSDAYNKQLAQRRADSVVKLLVDYFGIQPSRLKAIGYGEQRPLYPNANESLRAKNRRVVSIIRSVVSAPE